MTSNKDLKKTYLHGLAWLSLKRHKNILKYVKGIITQYVRNPFTEECSVTQNICHVLWYLYK